MLFRVSGKLTGNRAFASRIEAANALDASLEMQSKLSASNVPDDEVLEISARPVESSDSVYIGAAKKRSPRKKAATTPATAETPIVDETPADGGSGATPDISPVNVGTIDDFAAAVAPVAETVSVPNGGKRKR